MQWSSDFRSFILAFLQCNLIIALHSALGSTTETMLIRESHPWHPNLLRSTRISVGSMALTVAYVITLLSSLSSKLSGHLGSGITPAAEPDAKSPSNVTGKPNVNKSFGPTCASDQTMYSQVALELSLSATALDHVQKNEQRMSMTSFSHSKMNLSLSGTVPTGTACHNTEGEIGQMIQQLNAMNSLSGSSFNQTKNHIIPSCNEDFQKSEVNDLHRLMG